MQRLEVSCAVRRIYTSLGAKGLIQRAQRDSSIKIVNLLLEITILIDILNFTLCSFLRLDYFSG